MVRARHSIREVKEVAGKKVQQTFWDHHRTMSHAFAERSFQQRRQQIVGDCKQLKFSESGSNVVSQSIIARATRQAAKAHQASATGCAPKRHAVAANSAAVASSTNG